MSRRTREPLLAHATQEEYNEHIQQGKAFLASENYPAAKAAFESAIAAHEQNSKIVEDPLCHFHYGRALIGTGKADDLDAAQEALLTAMAVNHNSPIMKAYCELELGSVAQKQNDFEAAEAHFRQAIRAFNSVIDAHKGRRGKEREELVRECENGIGACSLKLAYLSLSTDGKTPQHLTAASLHFANARYGMKSKVCSSAANLLKETQASILNNKTILSTLSAGSASPSDKSIEIKQIIANFNEIADNCSDEKKGIQKRIDDSYFKDLMIELVDDQLLKAHLGCLEGHVALAEINPSNESFLAPARARFSAVQDFIHGKTGPQYDKARVRLSEIDAKFHLSAGASPAWTSAAAGGGAAAASPDAAKLARTPSPRKPVEEEHPHIR